MSLSKRFPRSNALIRSACVTVVSLLCVGLLAGSSRADAVVVDQFYTPQMNWGLNIELLGPIGQSFTPTLDRFNWAELWIDSNYVPGTTLQVKLHEGDSLSSAVLGTSDVIRFDGLYRGVVRFDFASPIGLTPGNAYSLEAIVLAGGALIQGRDNFGVPDPYAGGHMFDFGSPVLQGDLWFREGFDASTALAPVPEPGTMMLLGSGLAMAAGWSRKRFRR